MFQFSTKFAMTGALFLRMFMTALGFLLLYKTTLLALLAGGVVEFLTYIWLGTLFFTHRYEFLTSYLFLDPGQPSKYLVVWTLSLSEPSMPCLSDPFCCSVCIVKQVLLFYIQD